MMLESRVYPIGEGDGGRGGGSNGGDHDAI
jgi:hypothetical protein